MGTIIADICVLLTFLGFVLMQSLKGAPKGPEGNGGIVFVVLPPLLLLTVVLGACIVRNRFAWVPGGKVVHFLLLAGVVVGTAGAFFWGFETKDVLGGMLLASVPFAVLLCALLAIHAHAAIPVIPARVATALILGATGIFGYVLMGAGLVGEIKQQAASAEADRVRMEEFQKGNSDFDKTEFAKLPGNAEMWQLYPYMHSLNPEVRKACRERATARPDLDGELMVSLGNGWADYASSYIADLHPAPSARLAAAYGPFLEKQLETWKSSLQGDTNPGKWEPNLSPYFRGAERIQKAGGDLRPQLKLWYNYLRDIKGMRGLTMYIGQVIEGK